MRIPNLRAVLAQPFVPVLIVAALLSALVLSSTIVSILNASQVASVGDLVQENDTPLAQDDLGLQYGRGDNTVPARPNFAEGVGTTSLRVPALTSQMLERSEDRDEPGDSPLPLHSSFDSPVPSATSGLPTLSEMQSSELTITFATALPVTGSLEALPGLITLDLVASDPQVPEAKDVTVIVTGLDPERTYHRYLDHYGNHAELMSDARGWLTFSLDLSTARIVMIQDRPSTHFVTNGPGGGDCEGRGIGVWNATTLTCTLTTDLTETIQIGSGAFGTGHGITLDGNGHTIRNVANGLYVYLSHGVTIKNLTVADSSRGIEIRGANGSVTFANVALSNNFAGVQAQNVTGLRFIDSSVVSERIGLQLSLNTDVVIEEVAVTLLPPYVAGGSGDQGIGIDNSATVRMEQVSIHGGHTGLTMFQTAHTDFRDLVIDEAMIPLSFYWWDADPARMSHEIRAQIDGKPYIYTSNRTGEVIDNATEPAAALTCALCSDVTIKGYTFDHPKLGLLLLQTEGVIVEHNTFESPAGNVLQTNRSSGVIVRKNTFRPHVYAPLFFWDTPGNAERFEVYHNNFYGGVSQYALADSDRHTYSLPLPIGGNWWEIYDEEHEGCVDENDDLVCDAPFNVPPPHQAYPGIDQFPWTYPNAWEDYEEPQTASLSLPLEAPYDGVRGVASDGLYPERGVADSDTFTFKAVYTSTASTAPTHVRAVIVPDTEDPTTTVLTLTAAGTAGDDTTFIATDTFPKGDYSYHFEVDLDGVTLRYPEEGTLSFKTGYSSVAFIPGFQASRLFTPGLIFENKLWEPNRNADAEKLELNENGTSVNPNIYTKMGSAGVIDEAFGFTTNVYKLFLSDLDTWKNNDRLFADYAVLPYDWRYTYETILRSGVVVNGKLYYDPAHTNDANYILEQLKTLAEHSHSGKVTIVGHSMGGLIAKRLLVDLESNPHHPYRYLLQQIDTVVMVASPQLGTPKAVASLLHGMAQELDVPVFGWPNFATARTLRRLGLNLPSAYTLLPSRAYFERVTDLDSNGEPLGYPTVIGTGVTTYEALRSFLLADRQVEYNDLITPATLRDDLLGYGDALHQELDDWMPPDLDGNGVPDFRVVQIAGWGMPDTIRGIRYDLAKRTVKCQGPIIIGTCVETYLSPRPMFTYDGDGTVVLPSAVAMGAQSDAAKGVETRYIDLYQSNEDFVVKRSHASILEVSEIRKVIQGVLTKQQSSGKYISTSTDSFSAPEAYLRLALHSPVEVRITDDFGREVSVVRDQDGEVLGVSEEVPNSYYVVLGEGKFLGVPLANQEYTIELVGADEGIFTLELVEERNGNVHVRRTFQDVPVNPNLRSSITITTVLDVDMLAIDSNGDGVVDMMVYAEEVDAPIGFIDLFQALEDLNTVVKQALIPHAHSAESFFLQGKMQQARHQLDVLGHKVTQFAQTKLPVHIRIDGDKSEQIIDIIESLMINMD